MVRKLKIKLIKKSRKCSFIVVSLNKKSVRSHYIEKLGTIFVNKNKKYIFISLKILLKWLNKGVILNSYVSFLASLIYIYTKLRVYILK